MDMSWLIFISFLKHLHKCLCHKSKSSSKYTFIPVHYSLTMEEEAFNFLSLYLYDFYLTAKVRRLYDIANVLSSMNLIEKVIFSSVHFKFSLKSITTVVFLSVNVSLLVFVRLFVVGFNSCVGVLYCLFSPFKFASALFVF